MRILWASCRHPLVFKAISLIIGFMLWSALRDAFPYTQWVEVPICFYHAGTELIAAPETMQLELAGTRSLIRRVTAHPLAVHIDARRLQPGHNSVTVSAEHVQLPPSVSLKTALPHPIHIEVHHGDPT